MGNLDPQRADPVCSTRRQFLGRVGQGALAGGIVAAAGPAPALAAPAPSLLKAAPGKVGARLLGKTGLRVSEVGFGGHSWAYARVPDGHGAMRKVAPDEAGRMIRIGMEMGVNLFDCCTPLEEHTVPGEVLKRLKARDRAIVSARLCHKMKGVENDKREITKFVEARLAAFQTGHFDILMVTNTENDTKQSGYWDMSYAIEALDKMKQQGKIRFSGFGCHFTPELFLEAFEKYGRAFDVVSLPYNACHRAAEKIMPAAEKAGLGIVTIKPFARGELLALPGAAGPETGLARDMMSFVLQNGLVDTCLCGVHTEAHVRENFSGSWTPLTPEGRQRLERLAARTVATKDDWLDQGWRAV